MVGEDVVVCTVTPYDGFASGTPVSGSLTITGSAPSIETVSIAPNPAAAGGPPVWYLFHREYGFAPRPAYCVADYARVVVRKSTDKGVTWSDAHVIASPPPATGPANGTAAFADECAIVDGAGYFDERAGTWHYLVRHYSENCK